MVDDFRSKNLQGKNFSDENLTGYDFTNADIRGVKFNRAILENAKFIKVQAGLPIPWIVKLTIFAVILTILSGMVTTGVGILTVGMFQPYFINFPDYTIIPAIILMLSFASLTFFTIQKGFLIGLVNMTTVIATLSAIIGTIFRVLPGMGAAALVMALVVVATLLNAISVGVVLTVTQMQKWIVLLLESLATLVAILLITSLKILLMDQLVNQADKEILMRSLKQNFIGAENISRSFIGFGESTIITVFLAVGIAGFLIFIGGYVAWYSLIEEDKFAFPRNIIIALSTLGGTSFHHSDLTNADFTEALLNNTNLNTEKVKQTNWYLVQGLERAYVGENYLKNVKIRQLVVTKDGRNGNFDHLFLQGVNLCGASLNDASFVQANLNQAQLRSADLSRTKLVRTQLDLSDLTEATLTGAYLEEWGFTRQTIIDRLKCEYVFMRLPTQEYPNPVRKPDNWQENFEDGDFINFIRPWLDTLDLYHQDSVNPRLIAIALNRLIKTHPEAEIEIVAIQKKGKNGNDLLIKAKTAKATNRSLLHEEYFSNYAKLQSVSSEELIRIIAQQSYQIKRLENLVSVAFPNLQNERKRQVNRIPGMTKQVILKLFNTNSGFEVLLQISQEGEYPFIEVWGSLPKIINIMNIYEQWQSIYQEIVKSPRASLVSVKNASINDFDELIRNLEWEINQWLLADSFRQLSDTIFQQLNYSDEVRIIIQSTNHQVFEIPWHLWRIFDMYPFVELAFGISEYQKVPSKIALSTSSKKIKVLAILGDNTGINIEEDRLFLEQLPNCQPAFLVNPTRKELRQALWNEEGWDIFCFSGHSDSENGGQIYVLLNENGEEDVAEIAINDLKKALNFSIHRGLQLAIFNSCNGLEIAKNLVALNISQVIVMKEQVPDIVAQEFLKHFLDVFSKGQSFYLAVRYAREKLQQLESKYVCASWLPVIFQNPAHIPKSWKELCGFIPSRLIELLSQLQKEILVLSELSTEEKNIALEHIWILIELESNITQPEVPRIAKKSLAYLQGLFLELSANSRIVQQGNLLLSEIAYLIEEMIN